jgi:hypothetical protein
MGIDVGYIVAWTAQTVPPDFLLPLSGGTYNKSDFPELMVQHATHPIQVFASETATTFTLKNLNNGSFLKGGTGFNVGISGGNAGSSVNLTQANLPNVPILGATTNNSSPHTHTLAVSNNDTNDSTSQGWPAGNNHQTARTSDRARNRSSQGAIAESGGIHSHTVIIPSINGNVAQTPVDVSPLNTTIVWALKAKSTSYVQGDLTINNVTAGASSVTTVEIVDGTILTQDISTGGVTSNNILDGTITKADLANTVGTLDTGDFKYSMRTADHNGWILMNGRSCGDGSLNPNQQLACIGLAFPGNVLPQTSGTGQNSATYMADIDGNSATKGSIGGNIDNLWGSADLPNLNHSHTTNFPLMVSNGATGQTGGSTQTLGFTSSINNTNPGGPAALVPTSPRTLDANAFVYLGL